MKFAAFYLPQFHEIEENNTFWGEGFTEWNNVKRSESLFYGHRQPKLPTYLGYYNLLDEETIKSQMALAKEYGIDIFAVYIYWFNGKPIMDKPLKSMFKCAKEYGIEIFFVWANENWTRRWDGAEVDILLEQEHNIGKDLQLVEHYLEYFKEDSYLKINNEAFFGIYRPDIIPNTSIFFEKLKEKFQTYNVLIHITMIQSFSNYDPRIYKLDSAIQFPPHQLSLKLSRMEALRNGDLLSTHSYKEIVIKATSELRTDFINFPGTMTGWDNTPRMRTKGHVFIGSEAVHFYFWLMNSINYALKCLAPNYQIVFINAWNEWGEGAFLEPDVDSGLSKLNCVKMAKSQVLNLTARNKELEDSKSLKLSYEFSNSFKYGEYI